jgi:hypothetical protein
MRDFWNLVSRFESLYSEVFCEIKSFRVAACPADTSLPLGHGLPELLDYWQMESRNPILPAQPYASRSTRFMHLLHGTLE